MAKEKTTDQEAVNAAALAEKMEAWVRPKTKAAPTTLQPGEYIEYEDGSVWLVERSSEMSATVRCVLGSGTRGVKTVVYHDKDGAEKPVNRETWTGHKPGDVTQISSARGGVKFVDKPEKPKKAEAADKAPQSQEDGKMTKLKANKPVAVKAVKAVVAAVKSEKAAKPKAPKAQAKAKPVSAADAKKRSEGALKAWATRRKQGWVHPASAKAPKASVKRAGAPARKSSAKAKAAKKK